MIERHRGIPTTTKPKFETKARTIRNRLGQLSLSLPRIDDKKRWAGYPGLAGASRKLALMIPKDTEFYVEPFAGTAKVYQELRRRCKSEEGFFIRSFTLNDKSEFIFNWLKDTFSLPEITKDDFIDCIKKHDSEKTTFLIDPPWFRTYYDQTFSCFDRESIKSYDQQIISLCSGNPIGEFNTEGYKIKGKFIITTRKENQVMLNSGFKNEYVESEYVVSGKFPQVLVTHNL